MQMDRLSNRFRSSLARWGTLSFAWTHPSARAVHRPRSNLLHAARPARTGRPAHGLPMPWSTRAGFLLLGLCIGLLLSQHL